jgi:hypothetical protein
MKLTKHHVPPRSVGAKFILYKTQKEHEAYHLLFRNAASYEECCEILKRDWWTPPKGESQCNFPKNSRKT